MNLLTETPGLSAAAKHHYFAIESPSGKDKARESALKHQLLLLPIQGKR
jgi:hypothetical protein